MSLKETIASDASLVFLNEDEFAEQVVYLPKGGGSRTILAVVEREPPTLMDDAGNILSPSFMIYVANSNVAGIASNEIDTGGDRIQITNRVNEVAKKTCTIMRMIDNDDGMLQIAVR